MKYLSFFYSQYCIILISLSLFTSLPFTSLSILTQFAQLHFLQISIHTGVHNTYTRTLTLTRNLTLTKFVNPNWNFLKRTDVIGQGAYGIVYSGTRRSNGQTVAIKRIPFADSSPEGGVPCNVIREISLLRELDHPNVVRLLDVMQAASCGGLHLIFEFVEHDLKTYMDRQQKVNRRSQTSQHQQLNQQPGERPSRIGLPRSTVRNFLKQILAGIHYCHTHRILHRDLKPHNVSLYII